MIFAHTHTQVHVRVFWRLPWDSVAAHQTFGLESIFNPDKCATLRVCLCMLNSDCLEWTQFIHLNRIVFIYTQTHFRHSHKSRVFFTTESTSLSLHLCARLSQQHDGSVKWHDNLMSFDMFAAFADTPLLQCFGSQQMKWLIVRSWLSGKWQCLWCA